MASGEGAGLKNARLMRVKGVDNPVDVLTKHAGHEVLTRHMSRLGMDRRRGRYDIAPAVATYA